MKFSVSAEYRILSSAGIAILLHRLLPSLLEKIHRSRDQIEFIGVDMVPENSFRMAHLLLQTTAIRINRGSSPDRNKREIRLRKWEELFRPRRRISAGAIENHRVRSPASRHVGS